MGPPRGIHSTINKITDLEMRRHVLEDKEYICLIGKQGSFCLFTYLVNLIRDKPGNKGWSNSFGEAWYLPLEFLNCHECS